MKKLFILGAAAVMAIGTSLAVHSAPYEDQKIRIQRLQESRLHSTPTVGMHGGTQNLELMQEMDRQMEQARGVERMTPEQMRNWITEHTRLMDRMHRQMMPDGAPKGGTGMPQGRMR